MTAKNSLHLVFFARFARFAFIVVTEPVRIQQRVAASELRKTN
jgi:hypothetical protein